MPLAFMKKFFSSFSLAAVWLTTAVSAQAQSVPPAVLEQLKVEVSRQPFSRVVPSPAASPNSVPVAQTTSESESELLSSYIGVGVNLGIQGEDTSLREDTFAIIGKTGLTRNLSIHNATIIGDDTVSTVAVTFGVPIEDIGEEFLDADFVAPFIFAGGGAIISFDEFELQPLATAGVDFPLAPDFTGTLRVNIGFIEDTEIGIVAGVGYNFNILDLFE